MTKNGKNVYFTDMKDYIDYVQKEFMKNNSIMDVNNNPLTYATMSNILRTNIHYVETLEVVATTYAINPHMLETILINMHLPYSKFKTFMEKTYRFIQVESVNGVTVVRGLVDGLINNVFLNQRLLDACAPIIQMLQSSPNFYMLNGQLVSLYTLMKTFDTTKPSHIERNKGLGEMMPEQLAESTLHPGSNRTLIRYTVENIKKEIEQIRYIDANRDTLLKDVKVSKEDVLG